MYTTSLSDFECNALSAKPAKSTSDVVVDFFTAETPDGGYPGYVIVAFVKDTRRADATYTVSLDGSQPTCSNTPLPPASVCLPPSYVF